MSGRAPRLSVWPPLPLGVYARRPAAKLPFPLENRRCRLYRRARHGLYDGVRAAGLGPGDEVIVPAYHHGSEIEALARAGLTCAFYDVGPDLAPDRDEVESLVSDRTRAFHLTHFLGFPQDAAGWRRWCDARGLLLIEDAAQAWLASAGDRPVGSFGHISILCLYKTFGLPDGAALLAATPPPSRTASGTTSPVGVARRHVDWLMGRSAAVSSIGSRLRSDRVYVPEEDFALGQPSAAASWLVGLVRRVVDPRTASVRRANFQLLAERAGPLLSPAFRSVTGAASPFAFPVETDDKQALLDRLRAAGVVPLDFWSVPHPSLAAERYPHAARLRRRVVGLPVHQELRQSDLERIANALPASASA